MMYRRLSPLNYFRYQDVTHRNLYDYSELYSHKNNNPLWLNYYQSHDPDYQHYNPSKGHIFHHDIPNCTNDDYTNSERYEHAIPILYNPPIPLCNRHLVYDYNVSL